MPASTQIGGAEGYSMLSRRACYFILWGMKTASEFGSYGSRDNSGPIS